MIPEIISSISQLALGFLAGAGSAVIGLRGKIDESLRAERARVYKDLWKATGELPKWPVPENFTYDSLRKLTVTFKNWYFEEGGMYLSQSARAAYGDVQMGIESVIAGGKSGPITHEDYEYVRDLCSRLRSELTEDLLSRTRLLLNLRFQKRVRA